MKRFPEHISGANVILKCFYGPVFFLLLLLGCSQNEQNLELGAGDEEGYLLVGEIKLIDEANSLLKVAHEDIPGFMPAMIMDFSVSEGDLQNAKVGQRIKARMVRDEEGGFQLMRIWPLSEEDASDLKKYNERLQKRLRELPLGRYLGEGDESVDFALLDHRGNIVTSDDLLGRSLVMNFIFTRCPDANMCPLSTSKMGQLQKLAKEADLPVNFVSVSMDPEFDTPGVLRQYAKAYGIEGDDFYFVTGPKPAVLNLLRSYGVTAIEKVDTIMHSLATLLIDQNGEILMRSDKSAWEPETFLEKRESTTGT
ncbi:MAG: SCO family protein [Opitutales bacterium]|nr:SCO family protein [Opitutales bacterium]